MSFTGKHGALPGERDRAQRFEVELELEVDLTRARASDDLADTVDYATLHATVADVVHNRSYALLERLADEIARTLLGSDERIGAVCVTIAKPRLLRGATPSVSVRAAR